MTKMKKITNYTIGSDPEFFLVDRFGAPVSAVGMIGGTKENPKPLSKPGFAVQEDNVMVEFNLPPVSDPNEFYQNLLLAQEDVASQLYFKYNFSPKCSLYFSEEQLANEQAQMFGCDPDYNGWTMETNPSPAANASTLRTAGGHVHVGYENPEMMTSIRLVQAMDLFLGVPSVINDPDKIRKQMYGKAAACRLKSYGVEYRTLSNFWLQSKEAVERVFKGVEMAVDFVNKGKEIDEKMQNYIQTCINLGNPLMANEIMSNYKIAI